MHYYNGTVIEVIKIAGNSDYLKLMENLAKISVQPSGQTRSFFITLLLRLEEFLSAEGASLSWREEWLRWLKRKLGRQAKADGMEIIRDIIFKLKQATEEAISQPVYCVAVTAPDLPPLNKGIINAALRDLNLHTWVGDSPFYTRRLVEADTVYAANGYGLCRNYQDLFECSDEFENSATPRVYLVFFSRRLLYTSIIRPTRGEALATYTSDKAQLLDFDVGLDRLAQAEPSDYASWDHLRRDLLVLPRESSGPITHVLLAGESATHPRFLAILRDVLADTSLSLTPSSINPQPSTSDSRDLINIESIIDPTFAAARGAALYARRRQEVQSECTEPAQCEIERSRERLHGP